jgi:hypothetical protein
MRWAVGFALLMALVFALTYGYVCPEQEGELGVGRAS